MFDRNGVYASKSVILVMPVNDSICQSNPCHNGGTCFVDGEIDDNLNYNKIMYCMCPVGYKNKLCEGEYYKLFALVTDVTIHSKF